MVEIERMVGFSHDLPPAAAPTAIGVVPEGAIGLSPDTWPLMDFFANNGSALEGVVAASVKKGVFDFVGVTEGGADDVAIAASTYGGSFCVVAAGPAVVADADKTASVVTLPER